VGCQGSSQLPLAIRRQLLFYFSSGAPRTLCWQRLACRPAPAPTASPTSALSSPPSVSCLCPHCPERAARTETKKGKREGEGRCEGGVCENTKRYVNSCQHNVAVEQEEKQKTKRNKLKTNCLIWAKRPRLFILLWCRVADSWDRAPFILGRDLRGSYPG
jgi:hypothetical protein